MIRTEFNASKSKVSDQSIFTNIKGGLSYVVCHPILRAISIMMALANIVFTTANTQLILFAKQSLLAKDTQVGFFYSAASIGVVILSLSAGLFRKRWPFSTVALGALMLRGLFIIVFAWVSWYWGNLLLWMFCSISM
ncbi:hypothetical protein [Thermosporothrix hazakensis]|nr:hypothetical protein [Thermosporothrix hazakensis]